MEYNKELNLIKTYIKQIKIEDGYENEYNSKDEAQLFIEKYGIIHDKFTKKTMIIFYLIMREFEFIMLYHKSDCLLISENITKKAIKFREKLLSYENNSSKVTNFYKNHLFDIINKISEYLVKFKQI